MISWLSYSLGFYIYNSIYFSSHCLGMIEGFEDIFWQRDCTEATDFVGCDDMEYDSGEVY